MATHLLAAGLNYPGTSYQLAGCRNDATDIADRARSVAKTCTTLFDNAADRAGMLKATQQLLGRLLKGDVGIITLSSHGTREKHKGKWIEAVVCADGELIYDFELHQLLSQRAKGSLLLLAGDLCNSGGLSRGANTRTVPLSKTRTHAIAMPAKAVKQTWLAWTACRANESAWDASFDGRPNGAFTYWMLKALDAKPATFGEWFKKIAGKRPKGFLPSEDYPQNPEQSGSAALQKRKVPF